jgi:hypothetical protein
MPYAVLQTDLNPPGIEQMARAFRSVPGLTPADAHILGKDAFGILVKDFSEQQAGVMQGALRIEGIETEIVDQSFLPSLPTTKFVRRLDCSPEHLLLYDPVGRSFALDWRHIIFIAAGAVRLIDFVRDQETRQRVRYTAGGMPYQDTEYETFSREEQNSHLIGEIIITGATLRYSFDADNFNFVYLGERNTKDRAANFVSLVRDLTQFGANAQLNRGAAAMRGDAAQIFSYPSKNAFYEEIIWTLWQMKKAAA